MFIESISAASLASIQGSNSLGPISNFINSTISSASFSPNSKPLSGFSSSSSYFSGLVLAKRRDNGFAAGASSEIANAPLTGVVFEPFKEVKKEELMVPITPDVSLCRQRYSADCEAAVNEQINVEYSVSYVYHALYAYFDRDNVALKGFAKFFKEASKEERDHAEKLMEYQNKRGGRVKLCRLEMPLTEFDHADKGDALYAMELALALEKLTNEKLLKVHSVMLPTHSSSASCKASNNSYCPIRSIVNIADEKNDPQLADFIESEFLEEQVEAIKKISEYVAQLRRVGKGHGVWHFDQMLLHEQNV